MAGPEVGSAAVPNGPELAPPGSVGRDEPGGDTGSFRFRDRARRAMSGHPVVPEYPSRVDLHAHSRRSDGILEPRALVDAAAAAGVRVLALADHDTWPASASSARSGRRSFRSTSCRPWRSTPWPRASVVCGRASCTSWVLEWTRTTRASRPPSRASDGCARLDSRRSSPVCASLECPSMRASQRSGRSPGPRWVVPRLPAFWLRPATRLP